VIVFIAEAKILEMYAQDYEQSLCDVVRSFGMEEVICPMCQKYVMSIKASNCCNKHIAFKVTCMRTRLGVTDVIGQRLLNPCTRMSLRYRSRSVSNLLWQ